MPFELHVGDSPETYGVTYSLYQLVSAVLHREFDFARHLHMFTRAAAEFDPVDLLREAEMLKDMAKALDKGMVVEEVRLLEKTGGKSGDWRAP